MARQTIIPSPGIYYDKPYSEYRGWDAVNKSRLDKLFDESPLHYDLDGPSAKTRSTSLGDVFHARVLEPVIFAQDYTLQSQCSARTGKKADGPQCSKTSQGIVDGKHFCTTHLKKMTKDAEASGGEIILDPVQIVSTAEWDASGTMMDRVMKDPTAGPLIMAAIAAGTTEVSIVWVASNGILCKARIDIWDIPGGLIADLKSCKLTNVVRFMKEVDNRGYHRQGSFYTNGSAHLDEPAGEFWWIVAENHFPWDVVIIKPGRRTLEVGDMQMFDLLQEVERRRGGEGWPGASLGEPVVEADLPDYRLKQYS